MSEIHGRIVSVHVCTGYSHKGSRFLSEKSRHWSTGPQVHWSTGPLVQGLVRSTPWVKKKICSKGRRSESGRVQLLLSSSGHAWFLRSASAAGRSLQHDVFEVFLQDGVLDGVEDEADVFGVHSGGEVVEERFPPVSPFTTERLHQERLETEGDKLG